ncbi:Conserved_hypothetical protein [Hexamita inflata]|uniref:PPC domain-containing protein n=1 Tax=Hexamita inflata TaxID=28002 RepID=A0AA86UBZ7_9EUKA|nr:Conserved hypothetical protein [Hexamita inflata]
MKPFAFRLIKHQPLKASILSQIQKLNIQAGSVISGVGCLLDVKIRLANESQSVELKGPLEILTLSGTITPEHLHLHISVADNTGKVTGGHLIEGTVSYTCEICAVEYQNLKFTREHDENTGFTELVVKE